jgi:S-adenosylmethionine-diacylgycerolhomoserine-N-methlytransferase
MSLLADAKILWHLALRPVRGATHAERLESFEAAAEAGLSGVAPGTAVWLDLGGGTGENLEHLGDRLDRLSAAYVVDLAPSLLRVARERIARRGWSNVRTLQADVTTLEPPAGAPVDVVTFSYSLTMIPDWQAAIDRALELLRPGGVVGVVDFYVSEPHAPAPMARHGWWTRAFWPKWFGLDHVHLGPDRLATLRRRFETIRLTEATTRVPYVPLGRVPYFTFVGRKP